MSTTPISPTSNEVRTRFAPSPTGFLHIGGVRTALYSWLYARRNKGKFLLRIEDTDLERSIPEFTDDIMASMKWLGLNWDEEPLFQSKRLDLYRDAAEKLIQKGFAYRCYCSEAEVESMRESALKEGKKPMYDRRCRNRTDHTAPPGISYVIRACIPLDGSVKFQDLIHGDLEVRNTELDDFVLIRSNGAPTYNFSVVIDDAESRITHVIRGDDHINNTPKQVHLYHFLGLQGPKFGHLSMILGPDKKKLSKRHGAVSANVFRSDGYLPETILNFLARLGWSHGDQEIFTIDELISFFDFDHVQKPAAVFNTEKLLWLSGVHVRQAEASRLAKVILSDFPIGYVEAAKARLDSPLGHQLIDMAKAKVKKVNELAELVLPLVCPELPKVDTSVLKWHKDAALKPVIKSAVRELISTLEKQSAGITKPCSPSDSTIAASGIWPSTAMTAWTEEYRLGFENHEGVEVIFKQVAETHGVKLGDLAQPIRLAVTGRASSVGLFELFTIYSAKMIFERLRMIEGFDT